MPAAHNGRVDVASSPERPAHERTHLLHGSQSVESLRDSPPPTRHGRFFEDLAEGVQKRDLDRLRHETARYVSFIWAVVCSGCAGSITAYSIYGPLFLSRLHYTQYRVNVVSIVAAAATYGPLFFVGLLNDRRGPHVGCLAAGALFCLGYLLAAFTYRSGPPPDALPGGTGWPFGVMLLAFVCIGLGTSTMHVAGMTTCAKNFGRGKHKGFALSAPIAAFGLSGFWQSQIGSRLLTKTTPDGLGSELDVFRFFIFLGSLLASVGFIAFFLLRLFDEDEILDEAVEELERSGLLEDSDFFRSTARPSSTYGTAPSSQQPQTSPVGTAESPLKDTHASDDSAAQRIKKTKVLNAETKRFLTDQTMWWLAGGFFLVTGPGEAFINNLGTLIGTLYPPPSFDPTVPSQHLPWTPPATHVSVVAITSTIARLLSGTMSDFLAPPPLKTPRSSIVLSPSLDSPPRRSLTVSRMYFLLLCSVLFAAGFAFLASGAVQDHAASRFWLVSATTGLGYGAAFSLVPILISCVWGVDNFATNFGVVAMVPALGSAMWGIVYATEYSAGASHSGGDSALCYGVLCYRATFWGEAAAVIVACGLWVMAWKGPGGWQRKGIVV